MRQPTHEARQLSEHVQQVLHADNQNGKVDIGSNTSHGYCADVAVHLSALAVLLRCREISIQGAHAHAHALRRQA